MNQAMRSTNGRVASIDITCGINAALYATSPLRLHTSVSQIGLLYVAYV